MSTSLQSAKDWLNADNRSVDELEKVIQSLETRLNNNQHRPESELVGSRDALAFLIDALDQAQAISTMPAPTSSMDSVRLDLGSLDNSGPITLDPPPSSAEEKQQRFRELQLKLGKSTG